MKTFNEWLKNRLNEEGYGLYNTGLAFQQPAEEEEEGPSLKQEMMDFLGNRYGRLEENWEDDAEVAIYWFAAHYHSGQKSELYSILSTNKYSPNLMTLEKEKRENPIIGDMYDDLVENFGKRV